MKSTSDEKTVYFNSLSMFPTHQKLGGLKLEHEHIKIPLLCQKGLHCNLVQIYNVYQ